MTTVDGINLQSGRPSPNIHQPKVCGVDGCDRKHLSRGMCGMHYHRWWRGKPLGDHVPLRDSDAVCGADDCQRPARMWGYCTLHGQRFRSHGDPRALGWGKTSDDTETHLYRLWNDGGDLLYVGVSIDIERRFTQHRKCQPWWDDVAAYGAQSFPSRSKAFAAEALAVATENPRHNKKLQATA